MINLKLEHKLRESESQKYYFCSSVARPEHVLKSHRPIALTIVYASAIALFYFWSRVDGCSGLWLDP